MRLTAPNFIDEGQTRLLIKGVPYFQALDDEGLNRVAQAIVVRYYRAGEVIFLEGDSGRGLHLVVEGVCKVFHLSLEGREHILHLLEPGEFCNEVSAVDGGPNPANLAAAQDTTVWVVTKDAMDRLRQQYPVLNDVIIHHLAQHCRHLVKRIYTVSFLSVTGRLAAFLLREGRDGSILDRHTWTQDEIAAHLGTVREMVVRSFRELEQAGLIAFDRHQIKILDEAGLKELI
jgi:CRP/FNR family transcriptional regulator